FFTVHWDFSLQYSYQSCLCLLNEISFAIESLSTREKFMDEFLGFRRRERLKPSRPTTKNPKAFSGHSLCQQRVTGA
ncbi:hypothetical protein, partial [Vibrio fluvialis]|uniref:hypothetical protein n=1 Tax=Vibrio fluvialis TaxID=676 RepID=UPI001ABDCCF7